MVGAGAASRVRHRCRERRHARSHARRLRFAAAFLRGWRDRVLPGFAPARLRLQARWQGLGDVDDESRRLDRARLRRRGEEADAEPGGGHDAGVLPGRKVARRARAATRRLRGRPLVSRRVRSRDGSEAHAVHDSRPVGGRFQVLARRKDDLVHRGRATARATSTRCRPPAARRSWPSREVRSGAFQPGQRVRGIRHVIARRAGRSVSGGQRRHAASAHQRECRVAGRTSTCRSPRA